MKSLKDTAMKSWRESGREQGWNALVDTHKKEKCLHAASSDVTASADGLQEIRKRVPEEIGVICFGTCFTSR